MLLSKKIQVVFDYFMITLGSFISAIGLALFNIEADVVPGGVTGLSMTINFVFDYLTVGQLIILLNIPLFIWASSNSGAPLGFGRFMASLAMPFLSTCYAATCPDFVGFISKIRRQSSTCSRTISFSSSSSAAFSSALGLVSSSSSRARRLGQKSSVRFSRSALEYRRGFR